MNYVEAIGFYGGILRTVHY